jgi:arylformamidase
MSDALIYLNYTQEELNRAYNQGHWANVLPHVERFAADGARAIARHSPTTVQYGPGEREVFDVFVPKDMGKDARPIVAFFHGGAWEMCSKQDASGPAETFVDANCVYVSIDFDNVPQVRLPIMVEQCRRALVEIRQRAAEFGGDPARLFVAGSSSGGHLAAMMLATDWSMMGQPSDMICGGMLFSGLYDLEPVTLSHRGEYLGLSEQEVEDLSPLRFVDRINCPVLIAWGDHESPEFQRQNRDFADALAASGTRVSPHVLGATNHFEVQDRLGDRESELSRLCLSHVAGVTGSAGSGLVARPPA